jgi:hypothetical protein
VLGQRRRRAREREERQRILNSIVHETPQAPMAVIEEHPPAMHSGLLTPPLTLSPPHEPRRSTRMRTTLGQARDRDAARQATARSIGQQRRRQYEHEAAVDVGKSEYLIHKLMLIIQTL